MKIRRERLLLKSTLVQIYRNSDLYTLYYDQEDGEFYKIPFRKKSSFINTYLVVVGLIVIETLVSSVYGNYHSLLLNISLVVIGIAIAYYMVKQLYKSYYMIEDIRPMYLDNSFFESCASEGIKQSRKEIPVLIISLLLSIVSFGTFLFANNSKLLILGSMSTACFLSFYNMKPLKRRSIIKKLQIRK